MSIPNARLEFASGVASRPNIDAAEITSPYHD